MGKWLVAGGVALIVILLLLWRQLDSSSAAAPTAAAPEPAAPRVEPVAAAPEAAPKPAELKQVAAVAPADPSKPKKLDPRSDEFFFKHDEIVVPKLMRSAVKCWENLPAGKQAEFNRNQSIVMKFKQKIRNGTVTIHDVEVERTSIGDAALEACFVQQIRGTTWHDDVLPDWDQDDEIKLGPRTLKKYTRENVEYVGPEMPRQ